MPRRPTWPIRRVDILHAEWNNSEINRGVLSCVGDKYEAGKTGYLRNWVVEDLVTETAVPLVFRISPHPFSRARSTASRCATGKCG